MLFRLIRIYTPFICALSAIIHGVLYLLKYEGELYWLLGNLTGHSILLISYIIATSKRMCIWYKVTTYLLLLINIVNIMYRYNIINSDYIIYIGIVINFFALISFLIYRVTVGITKFLC